MSPVRPKLFWAFYPKAGPWRQFGKLADWIALSNDFSPPARIKLRARGIERAKNFLKRTTRSRDWRVIERNMEDDPSGALLEALGVEFRKSYQVAEKRAAKAWDRSDFRYYNDFLIVTLGFVKTDWYERKR